MDDKEHLQQSVSVRMLTLNTKLAYQPKYNCIRIAASFSIGCALADSWSAICSSTNTYISEITLSIMLSG